MGNYRCYRRLASSIAVILTFITAAVVSPEIAAAAPTRIISLSGDLDFGRIPLHSSAQRTLTISNAGNSVLTINHLDYPPEPVFIQVDFRGNFSGTIAPGASRNVVITFTPLGTSIIIGTNNDLNFQGYLSVESNATDGTNYIAMSGVGTWPPASAILSLDHHLDFGSVPIGTIGGSVLTLTNSGTLAITISNITFPVGFSSHFAPFKIDPGTARSVGVDFNPTNVGTYGGIAIVSSDSVAADSLGNNQFTVSGIATYPAGKYLGLFAPTNDPAFDSSGYITANCSAKGKLNVTITLAGKRYPFSGQVSPSGTVSGTIARKKSTPLNVSFQYDTDVGGKWTGTIDDGTWTATLRIERAILINNRGRGFFPVGQYEINIAGSTNSLLAPAAPGTGTLKIKVSRATHVVGVLGDGTKFSQNTILCANVPFYAPLYGHRGAILGWIAITPFVNFPPPQVIQPSASIEYRVTGTVNWFKPAGIDPDYPDGFSFQTPVTGSLQ